MTNLKNTDLTQKHYDAIKDTQKDKTVMTVYINISERYGDPVPVTVQDYLDLNPEGDFSADESGIYEGYEQIAEVQAPNEDDEDVAPDVKPASYDDLVNALRVQISPDGTPDLQLAALVAHDLTNGALDLNVMLAWVHTALKPFAEAAREFGGDNPGDKWAMAVRVCDALSDLQTAIGNARDDQHVPY